MNKIIFTLLCSLCLSFSLIAQTPEFVNRGGLGYVKFGLGFGSPNDLNDDLTKTFGQNAAISGSSYQIGAGGFLLFSKRIIVGMEGYGYFHSTEEAGPYSAKLTGGGGELRLGLALWNNTKFLGFPYIGIGFGGNRLEVKNDATEEVLFGETTVPEYFEERLRIGYPVLDLGISIIRIPAPDKDGLSIGGHIGFRTALGKDTWKMDNGDNVVGTNDMGLSTFYIKLSIGGGGFFHKKKKKTP
ncbi:MAG: hypothetical protein ACI8P3_001212 [Saprospiraceae bacterium]|jgi:hypothetical protein